MKTLIRPKYLLLSIIGIVAILILSSYVQLQRDIPSVRVGGLSAVEDGPLQGGDDNAALELPWPQKGIAAVSIGGAGLVGASRNDRSQPIASLAKVMTAYIVLKDHPLTPGEHGPQIAVQAADVQILRAQQANGESVIAVREGMVFTQDELILGLLIPSGNNFAHILANWNSGSVEAFVERMNTEAAALGLADTHYDEPSGVSPLTRSTARDQAKLAEIALANPVIAAAVNSPQVILPNVGVLYNVNSILGQDGIAGIKTGWTEEAGGCFLFAVDWLLDGTPVRIYGAVLGQDTLADAFVATKALIYGVGPALQRVPVVTRDAELAALSTRWGGRAQALAASDASLIVWPGLKVEATLEPGPAVESVKRGQEVGTVVYSAGDQKAPVTLVAGESLGGAGLPWRLTRTR